MPIPFATDQRIVMTLDADRREIRVPGSSRRMVYDPLPRTAIGITRLGTSEAVAIGAYAFALRQLG
jgi:glucokinase